MAEDTSPVSTPINDLPVDIFRDILNSLKTDKATLSSCSQVCRTWSVIARSMLFSSIKVNVAHVKSRHSAKKHLTPATLEGFIDQHPGLADIVQDLTFSSPDSWRTLSMSFVCSILPKLPRLHCLSLRSVTLEHGATSPACPLRVPRLRALRLAIGFESEFPLNVLFKHVTADVFEYQDSVQWIGSASCSISKQPMQRLEICKDVINPADFAFLSTYIAPGSLKSFFIEPEEWECIQLTCGLLQAVGHGLQAIDLDLVLLIRVDQSRSFGTLELDWTILGSVLSTLPQLESVSVRLPAFRSTYYGRPDDFEARYAIFPGIFASQFPPSPYLSALAVRMVGRGWLMTEQSGVELWGMGVLDAWASHTPCPRVLLEIDARGPNLTKDSAAIREAVEGALPNLREVGLLRVVDVL